MSTDPLLGKIVTLPLDQRAMVLNIEHEYDDGTTLRIVSGPNAGSLTMRDTRAIRRYAEAQGLIESGEAA